MKALSNKGKHLNHLAIALSLTYLLAAVSFKFPLLFTTDILRFIYDRYDVSLCMNVWLLVSSMVVVLAIVKSQQTPHLWINGLILLMGVGVCQLQNSPLKLGSGMITIGLDWLIIDFVITAAIFTPLEILFPKEQPISVFQADWKLNLTYFMIFDLNIKFILFAIKFPANYFFSGLTWDWLHDKINVLPFPVALLVALIIADLAQYLRHFLAHKIPFLWRFHAVHHSSQTMNWLAGSRSHLIDLLLDRSFIFIPIYVLGFNESVLVAYTTIVALQSVWAHANSHIDLGWLKYVIVTPQYHHWHHAKDVAAHDKNFAVHFPFIDMIFGTYHSLKHGWPNETGIQEADFPKSNYLKQFLYPFKRHTS